MTYDQVKEGGLYQGRKQTPRWKKLRNRRFLQERILQGLMMAHGAMLLLRLLTLLLPASPCCCCCCCSYPEILLPLQTILCWLRLLLLGFRRKCWWRTAG